MAGSTKYFDLVSVRDRPYFLRATVVGLRAQLEGLGLASSGLKVDLYLRLRDEGYRLYTDDVFQSDSGQSESGQSGGDQSGDDQPGDGQPGDNNGDNGLPDDEQSGDNNGGDDQGSASPAGAGQKQRRDDGGGDDDGNDNDDDNQGSPPPPPRKIMRVGDAIPAELQLQIMGNLNLAQLWNLIMAAPAGYLSDEIDLFALDARRQHAIDYPPVGSDDGGSGSGGSGPGSSPRSRDSDYDYRQDPNRPLSMLQWVGRRLIYDPEFGTAWRARILQLIDTYLQVYGRVFDEYGGRNVIDDILDYIRPQPPDDDIPFTLLRAAQDHRPDVVHLLLLRGDPVDQTIPGDTRTALSRAMHGLAGDFLGSDVMYTIFALIGAGADVTLVNDFARMLARGMLRDFMLIPDPGTEDSHPWPRIVNVRGLSVREFIADPRSDYFDRIKLAMYVMAFARGDMEYPGL